jgi:zinc protease
VCEEAGTPRDLAVAGAKFNIIPGGRGSSSNKPLPAIPLLEKVWQLVAMADEVEYEYAVVHSQQTEQLWPRAISTLRDKYEAKWPGRVKTILYKQTGGITDVRSCLQQLSKIMPRFCCFLAHHTECSKDFVREVNRLTRELDPSHPYTDTIWGILTGLIEDDVILALQQEPLSIKRVVANCPVDLEKFEAGLWFSEFEKGVAYCKESSESLPVKIKCPEDATELIVKEISDERRQCDQKNSGVDMVISSGHATSKDWNLAYAFEGGKMLCRGGQLYGSTLRGRHVNVQRSRSPKILSAAGNCLMGFVSDEHCMALGWMHSANVVQMIGYVEPTWFGYGGWGVLKYFVNNPGFMSFAEAFFANQQSLLHQLHSKYSVHMGTTLGDYRRVYDKCFQTSHSVGGNISRECSGLIYDRDNVAFYGDPAWRAQLESNLRVYDFV